MKRSPIHKPWGPGVNLGHLSRQCLNSFKIASVLAAGVILNPLAAGQTTGDDLADAVPEIAEAVLDASKELQPITVDEPAQLFVMMCAGCHSIGGGELTGPDLVGTSAWPEADLKKAVRKMETEVGPLSDEQIDTLASFLRDEDRIERMRVENDRVAMEVAASYEPGSASVGRGLFTGSLAFSNRGLACSACHAAVSTGGGDFAPDLSDSFERMGEQPLLSACESTNFPVMRASYAKHPVLKQEAIHLVAFFESLNGEEIAQTSKSPMLVISLGFAMAAVCMFGVFGISLRKNNGVRAKLVREAVWRRSS